MRWAVACVLLVACWTNATPPANGTTTSTSATSSGATTTTGSGTGATTTATATGNGFDQDTTVSGPLPPGCKRMRKTFLYRCSGVPPEPGESNSSPTTICDNCLANADCKDQPGGECQETGNGACTGPAHLVCKYPEARCGNKICPEPVTVMPP